MSIFISGNSSIIFSNYLTQNTRLSRPSTRPVTRPNPPTRPAPPRLLRSPAANTGNYSSTSSGARSASSSGSASGSKLSTVLNNVFKSLIDAIINSIDPNLNPNEKGPVYTIIDGTINLVITIIDLNNLKTITPIKFNINSDKLLQIGNNTVMSFSSNGIPTGLTATSASISGALGQFLLLLKSKIPTIDGNILGANKGYEPQPPDPPLID